LLSKYVKAYAVLLFESAQKYQHLLRDINGIQLLKPTIRNNIINALLALSRYQGNYYIVKSQMKAHGVKHYKPDQITTFTRIFNTNAHESYNENTGCLEHYKYSELFLRGCKNVYISAVPKALLDEISRSVRFPIMQLERN
jgi:hypothetical protein